jgi:ankyrin repeat protein
LAAKKGFSDILQLLLDKGADITLKDYKNRNALEAAIEKSQRYSHSKSIHMIYQWLFTVGFHFVVYNCRISFC